MIGAPCDAGDGYASCQVINKVCAQCGRLHPELGDEVRATPKNNDFAFEFVGHVTGFRNQHIQVTDQEGNCFECDSDQLELENE